MISTSKICNFLNDEEDFYTEADIEEPYNGERISTFKLVPLELIRVETKFRPAVIADTWTTQLFPFKITPLEWQ